MTDTTPEAVERLAADCDLARKVMAETGTFETGQAIMSDAIATLRALSAEVARLTAQGEPVAWGTGNALYVDDDPAPAQIEGAPVTLTYTNYRGETAQRTITPRRVWFGSTEWHHEPQWLLTAFDHEKQADRDFALRDFGSPAQTPPEDVGALIAQANALLSINEAGASVPRIPHLAVEIIEKLTAALAKQGGAENG